jgi:hypothetical protein
MFLSISYVYVEYGSFDVNFMEDVILKGLLRTPQKHCRQPLNNPRKEPILKSGREPLDIPRKEPILKSGREPLDNLRKDPILKSG